MTSHSDLCKAFRDGAEHGTASHMFIRGNILYSYGEHFPMTVRLPDGTFLHNSDTYSSTTSAHQSCAQSYCSGPEMSFSATDKAGIGNLGAIAVIEEKDGSVLFTYGDDYYLSQYDREVKDWRGRHYLHKLRSSKFRTVETAADALIPLTLKEKALPYKRQGQWYFAPVEIKDESEIENAERTKIESTTLYLVTEQFEWTLGNKWGRNYERYAHWERVHYAEGAGHSKLDDVHATPTEWPIDKQMEFLKVMGVTVAQVVKRGKIVRLKTVEEENEYSHNKYKHKYRYVARIKKELKLVYPELPKGGSVEVDALGLYDGGLVVRGRVRHYTYPMLKLGKQWHRAAYTVDGGLWEEESR